MTTLDAPRWADAAMTMVHATAADALVTIPADPANADYAALVAAGIEIAPYLRWPSLAAAKFELDATVELEAARRRAAVVGTTDPAKLAVYQWKAEIVADGDDRLELIAPEAAARGLAPTYLAALIRAKAASWRELGLAIDAAAAAHRAAIADLADTAAAQGYDVTTGWPPTS